MELVLFTSHWLLQAAAYCLIKNTRADWTITTVRERKRNEGKGVE